MAADWAWDAGLGDADMWGMQAYLEGQGDLVSRLITPVTRIVTLVTPIV